MAEKILKHKIKPYPIETMLAGNNTPMQAHIVRLADVGFIVEVPMRVRITTHYVSTFELPVLKCHIEEEVVVVKTYDQFKVIGTEKVPYLLAEMQFTNLDSTNKTNIRKFLARIGQKD